MKNIIMVCAAVVLLSVSAFAFGPKSMDSQQVKGDFTLSNPANSTCTDIPIGRAGSITVTPPANTLILDWQSVVKSSGTAVAVKRSLNSNTAYRVSTGRADYMHPNTATFKFTNFTTGTVNTVCYDTNN
jgi:hypothetical protein